MKATKKQFCRIFDHLLGLRLRERMFFLYIVGGALPIILIGMYLISGTSHILVEEAKKAEIVELEMLSGETQELLNSVNVVSKSFYFDEKLEEIAAKQYKEYQEIVTDYRDYTAIEEVGNLYNRLIVWTSIYLENDTISENAHFVKVNDDIRDRLWYIRAINQLGGAVWQSMPLPLALNHEKTLTLTRLLRTRKGQNVGVLAMYVRIERLKEQVDQRDCQTLIVLNGGTEIISNNKEIPFSHIRSFVENSKEEGIFQKNIYTDGQKYVLTCCNIRLGESNDILQMVSLKAYWDILHQANKQNRRSILVFICSIVLSVSLILLFSASFSNRVNQFRKQMQKAASGNFDLEPSLGGTDEINELYGYLGTMIGDIQKLLGEIYQERLHVEQLKTLQKEAEFKVLASQINPHFLYNTLETIRMKARLNHEPEIEELVKMLAKILRKNIRAGDQDVNIQTEIELVESYLKIQKYRFEERIQYQIVIEDELEEYHVLPLILQPIVENSIIHGLETKEGIGHILIHAEQVDETILITIEDDGMGIPRERLEELQRGLERRNLNRPHIGVCNVHQRIRLKYGENYGLTISSIEGKMTRVVIRIPAE